MNKQVIVSLLEFVIFVGNAAAGVVPGRWEKVDSLPEGEDIVVVMKAGERIVADFRSADADSITGKPVGDEIRRIAACRQLCHNQASFEHRQRQREDLWRPRGTS